MSEKKQFDMPAAFAMLYLCGCVLTGTKPYKEKIADVSIKALYAMSKFHTLTALVCEGLELAGVTPTEETKPYFDAFVIAKQKAKRKSLLLDTERIKICAFMEQNGIWYMPLKGVILKDMYPKMGLRQMADNDILFDEAHRADVRKWFSEQGYEVAIYGTGNQDVYRKEPVYNYEMHISLFGKLQNAKWSEYYNTVKERLVKDNGKDYGYNFTDEDFYIYFIVHGFKHYEGNGNGVRFLCDLYVYLKKKQSSMNFAYIAKELQTLGLTDFERDCRELVTEIFCGIDAFDFGQLVKERGEMLTYFLTCGTYGTISKQIRKKGKLKYLLDIIFPGTTVLQNFHPIFRHKWLLPIGWIYRAVKVLFTRPRKVKTIFKTVMKTNRK